MTLQDFIKEKGIVGITKQKIPNKTMKKCLNYFKYIDTYELWYDVPDRPKYNTWFDIEIMQEKYVKTYIYLIRIRMKDFITKFIDEKFVLAAYGKEKK